MIRVAIEAPSPSDLDVIAGELATTYWSPAIPSDVVERAWAHSIPALARAADGRLVGFARAVSDRATFAWLCDVFVVPEARRQGVARALAAALMAHPELQGLRRWLLATRDAHGVYEAVGFSPIAAPERLMERMACKAGRKFPFSRALATCNTAE